MPIIKPADNTPDPILYSMYAFHRNLTVQPQVTGANVICIWACFGEPALLMCYSQKQSSAYEVMFTNMPLSSDIAELTTLPH